MQIQKHLFLLTFIIGFSFSSFANGGPDDGNIIYGSGDPHFLHMKNVELISEKLDLKVDSNKTFIHVTYRLHNLSSKPTGKIHYGFPVECMYMDCCDTTWQSTYVEDLTFKYNSKKLSMLAVSENQSATSLEEKEESQEEDENGGRPALWRKWFYTEFSIPANELITLEVSYSIANGFEDWSTSKSIFPGYSERYLHYSFSPASYWGKGTVKDFQVNIESQDELKISGLNMKREGNIYSFSAVDFNLKKARPLSISNEEIVYKLNSSFITSKKWDIKKPLSIKTSGTLKGFTQKNLVDNNLSTAWVEDKPGSGIGEWIELGFNKDIYLYGIVLVNGYTKSEKSYTDNNRIKKLKVEMERYPYEGDDPGGEVYEREIELADLPYQTINFSNFDKMATIVFTNGELGSFGAKKIRFTILEVYKGTKYDDTCVSEILVMGRASNVWDEYLESTTDSEK